MTHLTQKIADHLKKDRTIGGHNGSCIIYYCDRNSFNFNAWKEVKMKGKFKKILWIRTTSFPFFMIFKEYYHWDEVAIQWKMKPKRLFPIRKDDRDDIIPRSKKWLN